MKALGAGVLVLALSACGATQDEFASALPDYAGLSLDVQGGDPAALTVRSTAAVADADVPGTDLASARESIGALNGAVRAFLEQVAAVARGEGRDAPDGARVYGPADRCVETPDGCVAATFVLAVRRQAENEFAWVLAARPAGSAGEFLPVAGGRIVRGAAPHRGLGQVAFNLDNLKAVVPAYAGQGHLLAGFANGEQAKALRYRLVGFTPDAAAFEPVTAAFFGYRTAAGLARVRVARIDDYVAPEDPMVTSTDELGFLHASFHPDVGGRVFAVVTNFPDGQGGFSGDVPGVPANGWYYFGRACTDTAGVVLFKQWFHCPRRDELGDPRGPAWCVLSGAGTAYPPVVGTGTWAESCPDLPADLEEPVDPPADDPSGGSDEPGTSGAGLPEPPPASPTEVGAG
ncbi:MAG TPA: hypothetical protein VLS93_02900 [Anaeromyxobacteraceae bacterium]|nr:hypothetical protein [Anaeromyxobacteraceae bacterium]